MKIEGITEGHGSSLQQRAYEHAVAFRAVSVRRHAAPEQSTPSYDGAAFSPPLVADLTNSPGASAARQEVYGTSQLAAGAPAPVAVARPTAGQIDSDGDGWADGYDLPFDYFQILRRATIKNTAAAAADSRLTIE